MYAAYREGYKGAMGNSCGSNSDAPPATNNSQNKSLSQLIEFQRPETHVNCIDGAYPKTENDPKNRYTVPHDKVLWDVEFAEYDPIDFFAVQPVPIPEDPDFRKEPDPSVKWNEKTDVNRKSHQEDYQIVDNVARNPVGRTGMTGRGSLARFGPNHAADPIVTRWKREEDGEISKHDSSGKPVLQFISIKRADCGMWALPGGFVDTGEEAINALKREFLEETMNSEEASEEEKKQMEEKCNKLFQDGFKVYSGYVDDPRNTDHSWMETVAVNFHDNTGDLVGQLQLHAGDDAIGVKWQDINSDLQLYASHINFIKSTAERHGAHW